jgi:hypothetical protein
MTEVARAGGMRSAPLRIGIMMRSAKDVGDVGGYTRSLVHALLKVDTRNRYFLVLHDDQAGRPFAQLPMPPRWCYPPRGNCCSISYMCQAPAASTAAHQHHLKHSLPLATRARPSSLCMERTGSPTRKIVTSSTACTTRSRYGSIAARRIVVAVSHDAADLAVHSICLPRRRLPHGCRTEFKSIAADGCTSQGVRQEHADRPDLVICHW